MYVQSMKLLATLHAQREREYSESIEPDDDAAAIADVLFEPWCSMSALQRSSTQTM